MQSGFAHILKIRKPSENPDDTTVPCKASFNHSNLNPRITRKPFFFKPPEEQTHPKTNHLQKNHNHPSHTTGILLLHQFRPTLKTLQKCTAGSFFLSSGDQNHLQTTIKSLRKHPKNHSKRGPKSQIKQNQHHPKSSKHHPKLRTSSPKHPTSSHKIIPQNHPEKSFPKSPKNVKNAKQIEIAYTTAGIHTFYHRFQRFPAFLWIVAYIWY